ncbi:hypothetical protein Tco_0335065 [Tanacetum coccineum]
MRKHEKNSDKEDDFVVVDPLDMSDEEVQSNDEKKSNSKGSKAKSDRSKSKTISYKEVCENTDWKRKSPFYFSSDEESGDDDTKWVNDKDESSQATPKGQSSQAKAPRPKFGTWTATERSKSKAKGGLEKYSDAKDKDGTNSSDHKLVKRGITRLCKFRMTYGKPGSVKLKVTFDALNRVSGLHRALFSSFLGDLVHEHIGEISQRSKKKEIEADEEPPRGVMWLKGRLNKDGEFPDEEIRSLGEKLKDADDKIKEGTLNLDDGTDAMTVVFGKEKGGYARGVGSGVTYKKYFDLPRSRQATDERIELLQTQLDNER